MINITTDHNLNHYIPPALQEIIEKMYEEKINKNLLFENVIQDPLFLEDPLAHIALYTDHGVVHIRDIARLVLELLPQINGVLIPHRDNFRLEFMKAYACLLAYFHDIGMLNTTPFGRATHAEYVAHEAFSPHYDEIINMIWQHNVGGIPWKILNFYREKSIKVEPQIMIRELLALAYCHSKSSVPISMINNTINLQKQMHYCLRHTLVEIFWEKKIRQLKSKPNTIKQRELEEAEAQYQQLKHTQTTDTQAKILAAYYEDFAHQSYHWLTDRTSANLIEFTEDVLDTVRLIRSADAMRQRGTALKTSGDYQIFIDQCTANAVYALKMGANKLFLLSGDRPINSAEANLSSVSLTPEGNLSFAFYRGEFATKEATEKAINSAAMLIGDIQADVIDGFYRPPELAAETGNFLKKNKKIFILLESTEDNMNFTPALRTTLIKGNPALEPLIKLVPSLQKVPAEEKQRYITAKTVDWDTSYKQQILHNIGQTGHKVDSIPLDGGFDYVKLFTLETGQVLTHAGDYAGFVYIPLGLGLKGIPGGGYSMFEVSPWIPLGSTGVIRGDIRNATIVAENQVDILIIPKEIYLKHWHHTYSPAEFKQIIHNYNLGTLSHS
ncbi:hypothetical protein Lnau_2361 [Legionella nautarum]|uniref:Uncharacterized protein n=1 Tax=Legionella nautarum TaxID=45070 RepID=A0A0W0WK57_9GAMM|nr:hypothetical protein [Legionella nautarum]KTD32713.1 hypothetical protein Lnau_2361 [Legionella nautarum]